MKKNTLKWAALGLSAAATLLALPAHAGKDLDAIKKRGELICGASTGLAGFSAADSQGKFGKRHATTPTDDRDRRKNVIGHRRPVWP